MNGNDRHPCQVIRLIPTADNYLTPVDPCLFTCSETEQSLPDKTDPVTKGLKEIDDNVKSSEHRFYLSLYQENVKTWGKSRKSDTDRK